MWYNTKQQGAITLMAVIVVSAVGIAVALSLLLLGVGNSRTSLAYEQSAKARVLANACVEEAFRRLIESPAFVGSGGLTLGQGSCAYTIVNGGGANRRINSTGTVGAIVKKVKADIDQISPKINVVSWQDAADF